jgi:hypothetical protein
MRTAETQEAQGYTFLHTISRIKSRGRVHRSRLRGSRRSEVRDINQEFREDLAVEDPRNTEYRLVMRLAEPVEPSERVFKSGEAQGDYN